MGLRHTPIGSSGRLAPPWVPGVAAARTAVAEGHLAEIRVSADTARAAAFVVIHWDVRSVAACI